MTIAKPIRLFLVVITCLLIPGVAWGNLDSREMFIPTTISQEAKQILQTVRPTKINARTREEWQELFLQREMMAGKIWQSSLDAFPASIEEIEVAGRTHYMITPETFDASRENRLLIYVHGGGYALFTAKSTIRNALVTAHYSRTRVLTVDYPKSWEEPFPAQRDMVIAVYRKMLDTYSPECIGMYGDSAGANAIIKAVLKARDNGLPMPGVLGLISPGVDLSDTGDSHTIIRGYDPLLDYQLNLKAFTMAYTGEENLKDPRLSPIYDNYQPGFPPSYISTGTRDLMLSHSARLQRKLTDAGVKNRLFVHEGMWHVFQLYDIPEAKPAWQDMLLFFDEHLGM